MCNLTKLICNTMIKDVIEDWNGDPFYKLNHGSLFLPGSDGELRSKESGSIESLLTPDEFDRHGRSPFRSNHVCVFRTGLTVICPVIPISFFRGTGAIEEYKEKRKRRSFLPQQGIF